MQERIADFPMILRPTPSGKGRICPVVEIEGEDYEICDKYSKMYWANSKKGRYGSGLCATQSDPYKPVRVGMMGELAFAKLFGVDVDFTYREGGDRSDFLIGRYHVNVKCAMEDRCVGLVYCENDWGKDVKVTSDFYVFSYIRKDRNVTFVGYADHEMVIASERRFGRAKNSKHRNYEVDYNDLKPMSHMKKELF